MTILCKIKKMIVNKKTAICILTRDYNTHWIEFLRTFHYYDIYMVIDNTTQMYESQIDNIRIVQIPDEECLRYNYYNSSVASNLKKIVAWDRALYYFNKKNTIEYEHIWFMEDDVFFMSEQTLLDMDTKYPESDLLCAFHEINERGDIYHGWNHWVNVIHRIGTPWAHSVIAISRLSQRLLDRVDNYVRDRPLLFIEALFNTLALQNEYQVDNPEELKDTVTFYEKWDFNTGFSHNRVYHPIKNTEDHTLLRQRMIQ